jgi:hypothetical protein
MPKAEPKNKRVALTPTEKKVVALESDVNDIADLANLLTDCGEKWIAVAPSTKGAEELHFVSIPEEERKALMFGIYKLGQMTSSLRKNYYAALDGETAHAQG